MKFSMMKMACIFGSMGILGYLYCMSNPDIMKQMKKMGKDMTRCLYMYLDK